MDDSKFLIQAEGHSLELIPLGKGNIGDAHYCQTCDNNTCEKIAWFNKHYRVTIDARSPKGWHIMESRK